MTGTIQDLIIQYRIREAFWASAENIEEDADKQTLFLQLLSFSNNVALLQPDICKIRDLAENDCNPYMSYAYARLHDVLQPEEDSDNIKEKHYGIAAGHGIGDAYACLAYMQRDGDLGEQDMDRYESLMQKAVQCHSEKAFQQDVRNLVYGLNGMDADPLEAYELAENHLNELDFPNPAYYLLMAHADLELGRRGNASENFRRASEYGCSAAFYWWAVTQCGGGDFHIADRSRFMEIMQKGIDVRAADSFLMYALLLDDENYEQLDDDEKAQVSERLLNDLQTSWLLGEFMGPYFLGDFYENGRFGFEQDYGKAWLWYSRGAVLRNASCYEALARMILDDNTAPSSYDERYAYECAYKGLLLGCDELLEVVVRGYRNGFLDNHAAMIESRWLPAYEEEVGRMMDDHELDDDDEYCDDREYLYDGEPEREIEED